MEEELEALIGQDHAALFLREYAGVPVSIPSVVHMMESHPIAKLVGIDLARKIAKRWGGERVIPPMLGLSKRRKRISMIIDEAAAMRLAGRLDTKSLAKKHGLHVRTIQSILNKSMQR
jgi:predicted DNA-binding protein (UPF0251 family)